MTMSWSTGSIGWSCHGRDVPVSAFGKKRRRTLHSRGQRSGQIKVEAPCPKCENHWVTVGWEGE